LVYSRGNNACAAFCRKTKDIGKKIGGGSGTDDPMASLINDIKSGKAVGASVAQHLTTSVM